MERHRSRAWRACGWSFALVIGFAATSAAVFER